MKRKDKSSIKRITTFVISFAIIVTLLSATGIIRVDVRSGSNNLPEQVPPNYLTGTDSSFLSNINTNTKKSIVMFTSNWCGSCTTIKERLKELALEFEDIHFYIADIENYRVNALEYNVAITPALVTIENKIFKTFQEVRPQDLRNIVSNFSLLGL